MQDRSPAAPRNRSDPGSVAPPQEPEEEIFGQYTPGAGFRVAKTEIGELNLRVFTYVRYLKQSGLDPTYTNAFGRTSNVQQREDHAAQQGADHHLRVDPVSQAAPRRPYRAPTPASDSSRM